MAPMQEHIQTSPTERNAQLCVLTDSLPGAIRWRFSDYKQLLTKQLRLLARPELAASLSSVRQAARGAKH